MAFINILLLLPNDCAQGGPFRDVNRNGDAHFGSRAGPAPYPESRAHLLCPVTHSAKTPMKIALGLNGFGIDSAAVVANQHAQDVVHVLHFDLDGSRFGMT